MLVNQIHETLGFDQVNKRVIGVSFCCIRGEKGFVFPRATVEISQNNDSFLLIYQLGGSIENFVYILKLSWPKVDDEEVDSM